ncbi:MAG: bifunctional diguanylate cyclase/phosphodiesterase [Xanthobacteraceae bacterium]
MLRIVTCLTTEHAWPLVALAVGLCLATSVTAILLFHRALSTQRGTRAQWIVGAGAAAGCGIWATHFIATLACDPGIANSYDLALTIGSLLITVALTVAGLSVASSARALAAPVGGAVIGVGLAATHYTGMASLELSGKIAWSADIIIASIVAGLVFAAAAMSVAVRGHSLRNTLLAAILLTLAVLSHHFIAMSAAQVIPGAAYTIDASGLPEIMLAMLIAAVAFAVLGVSITGAIMDRRLSEKNSQLGTALDHMNHGLMMFDQERRVILCNQRYIELYRLPAGAIKAGMSLRDVVNARLVHGSFVGDPERYCTDVLSMVAHGTAFKRTTEMQGRTISVANEPLPGGGWVATHLDITEEKRRESSFRFLFDNNPIPMWVWDHATLRFLAVNNAALEQYGYDREHFLTLTVGDVKRSANWDSIDTVVRGDERKLREGYTSQHVKADGSLIEVAIYGRVMEYEGRPASLVAAVDVTERKHAEDELRQTREFLDGIVENVPMTVVVKNASDLSYVLVNRRAEEQFGRKRADVIGKTAQAVFPKETADRLEARDREMLATRREAFFDTHPVTTPAKGARFHTSRRLPILDANGEPRFLLTVIDDVTERKLQEDELRRTRAFLDTVVENIPVALSVKDTKEFRYALVNRAAEEFFGLTSEEMIGKSAAELFPQQAVDTFSALDREAVETAGVCEVNEQLVETPRNGTRLIDIKKFVVRDADGKAEYLLSLSEDVTERKRAQDRIAHLAGHDLLTDLPNRAAFNEKLAAEVERAAAAGTSFAVLCIGLDRFREVNDVFGHATGDAALRAVADRLCEAADGSYLARIGGDEFIIIVSGENAHAAETVAAALMRSVADTDIEIGEQRVRIGLSIGIAVYPSGARDADTLLANADVALCRAKAEGRGSIRFFEAVMDERLREKRALQQELRAAIEHGELALHYQPQARISGEISGFEALVRWHHPIRGLIQPGSFVPLAEESGLIVAMSEWILREGCREAASWPRPLQIAINLSPIQFRHGDLPAQVHQILLETGLAPHRLELEVTEGVLIDDFSRALSILLRLKTLGVRIAMDDFGTGYSSLSYLQAFPFDKIKIDRTFNANLGDNQHSAAIVRAVLGLGRGMNIPVVAEGVETPEQLAFLARESCEEVQGYLIGRPAPIDTYAGVVGREVAKTAKTILRIVNA